MTGALLLAAAGPVQGARLVAESRVGQTVSASLEWAGGPGAGPITGALRYGRGKEQIASEQAADYARLGELQRRYLLEGDRDPSLVAEREALDAELNQAFAEDPFEAYRRAPGGEQAKAELIGGILQGAGALALALSLGAKRGAGRSARPGASPLSRKMPWTSARAGSTGPATTSGRLWWRRRRASSR